MHIDLPEKVKTVLHTLHAAGYEAYAVGGCVRDSILGKKPKDWDITTSATPLEVKALFRRTIDTGIQHGTVTVLIDKEGFEVTTYRLDGAYEDMRHPTGVSFTKSLSQDLMRRDFTINAMAYNRMDGLVDLFGGVEDLDKKQIRCVGDPSERFDEDALRILRALRFSAQLSFEIEPATMQAIQKQKDNLRNISAERIREELNKILLCANPERLILAAECGITDVILPQATRFLLESKRAGSILRGIPTENLILAWGILCNAFLLYDHIEDSEERKTRTKKLLRDLKFDRETIEKASALAKNSLLEVTDEAVSLRRQMHSLGDVFPLWVEFVLGDRFPDGRCLGEKEKKAFLASIEKIKKAKDPISIKDLAITGSDLIAGGHSQGVALGNTLSYLLDQVLEHPEWNTRERLFELAGSEHLTEHEK